MIAQAQCPRVSLRVGKIANRQRAIAIIRQAILPTLQASFVSHRWGALQSRRIIFIVIYNAGTVSRRE
jgi:hypothetical protein